MDSPYYTESNLEIAEKIKDLEKRYNCTTSQILLAR